MHRLIPVALIACIAFSMTPAPAQEAQAEAEEHLTLTAEGDALRQELQDLRERIDSLRKQAAEAAVEDRGALETRVADAMLSAVRVIRRLVANLLAQEREGLPAAELRQTAEALLLELGPRIVAQLDSTEERLKALREQVNTVESAELPALQGHITRMVDWLDVVLAAYVDLVEDMQELGLDAAQVRADLTERLISRADLLEGRIQVATKRIDKGRKEAAGNPDAKEGVAEIQLLESRRKEAIRSLTALVRLMDSMGIDSSHQRQLMIVSTGEVTTDVFRKNVLVGVVSSWIDDARDWLLNRGPALGFRLILVAVILLVFSIIARIARFVVSLRGRRSGTKHSRLVQIMLQGLISQIIMLIGIVVAVSALGVRVGPLLAGLGIAGFIVGFALQDTLSNFASGVMILSYRPYDIDDFIEAGGVFGKVNDMSLVSTTILTIDNQTLIVPNSKIWGDVIKNITHQNRRRVDMKFRISYSEQIERAEKTLMAILVDHPKILKEPAPIVRLHELGEYAMEMIVRPWVETGDYWEVYWDVTREVKRRFDDEGISIPWLQPGTYVPRRE